MQHVVDVMVAVVVMVLLLMFGTSIIQAQVDLSEVRSCKDEIVAELENSNYNSAVVSECIRQAEANGYTLTVTLHRKGASSVTFARADDVTAVTDVTAAEVVLNYQYRMTCFSKYSQHTIRGFAG